jgi:hypothetical protein
MAINKTITTIFMVPTLGLLTEDVIGNGFINGYCIDKERDLQYEDAIYLLFKPKDLYKFKVFIDGEYDRTKQIVDDYDYANGYVVVVYQLDPKFKEDFDLIRASKYSKTSSKFQELFSETVDIELAGIPHTEISLQHRIFNKTKDLVDFWEDAFGMSISKGIEVWHGFDIDNETLNLKKVKEHVQ